MGERTDPLRLLSALASGKVYYDPGIKLEDATTRPRVKRRSQFRIASKNLGELYESFKIIDQALKQMPQGPINVSNPEIIIPLKDKENAPEGGMEGLIYHFKNYMFGHGVKPVPGEV